MLREGGRGRVTKRERERESNKEMVCVTDSGCSCITSSILRTNSLTGEYINGGGGEGEEREGGKE